MCRSTLKVMLMAMLLVVLSASLFAQQTGTITGTVVDKTGAVVSGAKVTLTNIATKDIRRTVANGEGFFSFNGAVTGAYTVKVEYQGFRTTEQSGINLSPGDRRHLSIELAVGKENEQITVEAAASQVQVVDSGERSSVLTSKDIKNLALQGRDVTELVKTLPGFSNLTGGGGIGNKTGYDPNITTVGSSMGNGYNANGTPTRSGGADLMSDGAHVIDPGCNCGATMTINADMVQEVKVTTSNFSADSSKGPVLVQAVGKSGSSEYHGGAYLHFRDTSMNSMDWNAKAAKVDKPKDRYWYPGGSFGGPVPFTNKKLLFWTGYEYYNQKFPDQTSGGVVKSTVLTDSMRAGNFDPNAADNKLLCSIGGWLPQCGGDAPVRDSNGQIVYGSDGKAVTQHYPIVANFWNNTTQKMEDYGNAIVLNGQLVSVPNGNISQYMDPGSKALVKMMPHANVDPTKTIGGYNYVQSVMSSDNGYMWRTRFDYNFNDSNKLYFSYNQQRDDAGIPVMLWWMPPTEVPFPGGFVAGTNSKTISGNYVKVISPTLTNEFVATLAFMKQTDTYTKQAGVSRKALGYPYHGIFGATDVMPSLSNGWWIPGYPMIYQADADGYYSQKVLPSFSDNLTKVLGTHTIKTGFNWEKAQNKQINFNQQNGQLQFGTWGASSNPVANLLLGVPTAYTESNANTTTDMAYKTLGFYFQDDWKASKRLTLNLGVRLSHDPAWTDNSGKFGLAAWTKEWYAQDVAKNVTSMPGMRWNAKDNSIPVAGRDVTPLFVAPRFGLSYDVFGTGKTVLRGGFGAYYYHDQYNDYASALSTAMGGKSCSINGTTSLADIDKGVNVNCAQVAGATAVNPNDDKQPLTYTYSFTVSQSMPSNSLLEVAYSGNQTVNLINPLQNVNIIPVGAFFKADPVTGQTHTIQELEGDSGKANRLHYKPMQQYDSLYVVQHGAWANYNALQVSWNKPRGSFTYGVNYTWSKTMGIYGQGPGGYNSQPDPVSLNNNYGVMNTDRSHVINATYSYEVGERFHGNKLLGGVINGWMISGITGIQSGAPLAQAGKIDFGITGPVNGSYSNLYVDNNAILGTSDYKLMPTILCDPSTGMSGMNSPYLNASCFGVPTKGTNGAYQPPVVRGPAYWNSDIALQKTFKLTERQNVQFRLSAFNFLNHALTSFDPNATKNLTLHYLPAVSGLADYANYTGAYKQDVSETANGIYFGAPNTKFGRRVIELSLKYAF